MLSRRDADPIAAVEAAYHADEDFEAWARGVVESVVPELDAGLGVVGLVVRASRPGSTLEVGAGALSEHMLEAVHQMTMEMPKSLHSLFFHPSVGTVSEILPRFMMRGSVSSDLEQVRSRWWDPFGVRDAIGVVAQADADRLFVITVPLPRITKLTIERRKRLARTAAHIGAGLRLRREPARQRAVIRPDGVVEHAEGRAKERGALDGLRRRAVEIDRSRSSLRRRDPEAALSLWKGLLDGEWSLVERFERDGRRYYVACENPLDGRGPRSLTPRERQVVELASRGLSNKLAAYTLGLSEASTSLHLNNALKKVGVRTRAELAVLTVGQNDPDPKK
jgi:DNA-binding CsgD family transcriptional regulator